MGVASQDTVLQTVSAFGLPGVSEWRLLPKSTIKRDEMVRVSFAGHPPVLVRFHDPTFYSRSDVEHQTLFRSRLHAGGIPVPALYRDRKGRLCIDITAKGETWVVTVEEWVHGEPPPAVTPSLVSLMGSTLARMHLLAESCGPIFGHGTDLSLFVEDEEYARNAERLRASVLGLKLEAQLETRLFSVWSQARERLSGLWEELPRGPVHADFAEYNVLLDETENIKAVIDFNLAGDEVFVNEVVHTCLRLPSFGDEAHDREYAARFLTAYEEIRPLSTAERLAVPYLITVIRPFRWREIRPVLEAANQSKTGTVLRLLRRLEQLAQPERLIG